MKNLLSWLRQNWPGVRGRRLIYERVGRLEARILELQIQTGRNLTQLGRDLDGVEARSLAATERVALIGGQIREDHRAGGELVAESTRRLAEAVELQRAELSQLAPALSGVAGAFTSDAERLLHRASDQFGAALTASSEHSEAIVAALGLAQEQLAAQLRGELREATRTTHDAIADLLAQAQKDEADWRQALESRLVALATLDQRLVALGADGMRRQEGIESLLERIVQAVSDSPARFLAVEAAAKARHESLVSLIPTIEYLASVLDAHRGEILTRLGDIDQLRRSTMALEHLIREEGERQRDLEVIWGDGTPPSHWPSPFTLRTDHPIAFASDDHRFPRGTANDNTRSPRFVAACERLFEGALTHLDLGCAGGGLVRDFLIRGHHSMGLEGSDWSLLEQRAEWRALGGRLRTCDITKPFDVLDGADQVVGFKIISAWEVLEHLPEAALPCFFDNVRRHLAPDGLFVASIASFEDRDEATGAVWHVTLQPPDWWRDSMALAGLEIVASPFTARDYVRGSGASPDDWDATSQPHMGFHVVARRLVSQP